MDLNLNEVSDIELEQVAGGLKEYGETETLYDFDEGDAFGLGNGRDFCVVHRRASRKTKRDAVECRGYLYLDRFGKYQYRGNRDIEARELADRWQYLGNGAINASNILE